MNLRPFHFFRYNEPDPEDTDSDDTARMPKQNASDDENDPLWFPVRSRLHDDPHAEDEEDWRFLSPPRQERGTPPEDFRLSREEESREEDGLESAGVDHFEPLEWGNPPTLASYLGTLREDDGLGVESAGQGDLHERNGDAPHDAGHERAGTDAEEFLAAFDSPQTSDEPAGPDPQPEESSPDAADQYVEAAAQRSSLEAPSGPEPQEYGAEQDSQAAAEDCQDDGEFNVQAISEVAAEDPAAGTPAAEDVEVTESSAGPRDEAAGERNSAAGSEDCSASVAPGGAEVDLREDTAARNEGETDSAGAHALASALHGAATETPSGEYADLTAKPAPAGIPFEDKSDSLKLERQQEPVFPMPQIRSNDSHLQVPAMDRKEPLREVLTGFLEGSKALTALFVTRQGALVASAGQVHSLDVEGIAALVAGMFAATRELARLIGEEEFSLLLQQGKRRHLHLSLVDTDVLMVAVFDDQQRAGAVRYAARKAAESAREVLNAGRGEGEQALRDRMDSGEFQEFALNLIDKFFQ